jgi:multimeric flavodoxin WrbA
MKTCLIHGTMRKGSTYHITKMILDKLDSDLNNEVTEFFLPKDMPNFCVGCYQCIFKGEQLCPHASSVNKIHQAMVDADLIIITSPVYVFDVSGQLKAMFDHFGYQWMSHRPNKTMFNKIGAECRYSGWRRDEEYHENDGYQYVVVGDEAGVFVGSGGYGCFVCGNHTKNHGEDRAENQCYGQAIVQGFEVATAVETVAENKLSLPSDENDEKGSSGVE